MKARGLRNTPTLGRCGVWGSGVRFEDFHRSMRLLLYNASKLTALRYPME